MPNNHERTPLDRVTKWRLDFQIHNQERQPINPSKLIIDGPEQHPVKDLEKKDFENLFFQIMSQGVALDDNENPHFFHPKTFLENTGRKISKKEAKPSNYIHGLNSIFLFKNLPENQNPTLQQEAKAAISEYLDPDLFANNFVNDDSELFEIFNSLGPEALDDREIVNYFEVAYKQRLEKQAAMDQRARERAVKTGYQKIYEPTPNPGSFRVKPNTTIDQILGKLKNSHNQAGFERVNALKKWGDFIKENINDPHYEEKVISFGSSSPHTRHQYTNDNTYAVIAFDYAGRRCMIAESCGSGGANSTSAAMKIWRSRPEDLADKQGWMQAFSQSKSAARGLLQDLRHVDFDDELSQRSTNQDHIIKAEDRLFRAAFHYFETGELLGSGKAAAKELDDLIGPEFRRPNPTK